MKEGESRRYGKTRGKGLGTRSGGGGGGSVAEAVEGGVQTAEALLSISLVKLSASSQGGLISLGK